MSTPLRLRSTANVHCYKVSLIGKDGKRRVLNCKPVFCSNTASTSRRNCTMPSVIERSLSGSNAAPKSSNKSSKRAPSQGTQSPKGSSQNLRKGSSSKKDRKSNDEPEITTTFLDETYRDLRGRFNRLRTKRSNSSAAESFCEHVEGCTGVGCNCPRGTEKITSTKIGGTNCDYVQETIIERSMLTDKGVQTTTKHIIKRCDKSGRVEVEVEESKHVSGQAKAGTSDTAYEAVSATQQQENKSQLSPPNMASPTQSQIIHREKGKTNSSWSDTRKQGSTLSPKISFSQMIGNQSMHRTSEPPPNNLRRGGYIQVKSTESSDKQSIPSLPPSVPPSRPRPHSPLECCPCICKICANYLSKKLALPLDQLDQKTLNSLVVRRPQDGRLSMDYYRVGEMLQGRALGPSTTQVRPSLSQPFQAPQSSRMAPMNMPVSNMRPRGSLSDMAQKSQGKTKMLQAPKAFPSEQIEDISEPSFHSSNFENLRAKQPSTSAQVAARNKVTKLKESKANLRSPVTRRGGNSRKRSRSLSDVVQPIYQAASGPPSKKPLYNEENVYELYHNANLNGPTVRNLPVVDIQVVPRRCCCRAKYAKKYKAEARQMQPDLTSAEEFTNQRCQEDSPYFGGRENYIRQGYQDNQYSALNGREPLFQPNGPPISQNPQAMPSRGYPIEDRQNYTFMEDHLAQDRYAEINQRQSPRYENYYRGPIADDPQPSNYFPTATRYPDSYPSRFTNRPQYCYPNEQRSQYADNAELSVPTYRYFGPQAPVDLDDCITKYRPQEVYKCDDNDYGNKPFSDMIDPDDRVISSGMPSLTEERLRTQADDTNYYSDHLSTDKPVYDPPEESPQPQISDGVAEVSASANREKPPKIPAQTDDNDWSFKDKWPSQTGECLNRQRPRAVSQLHRSLQHMPLSVNVERIEGITKGLQKPVHQISHTGKEFYATTNKTAIDCKNIAITPCVCGCCDLPAVKPQVTQSKIIDAPPSGSKVIAEIIIPIPIAETESPADTQALTEVRELDNNVIFTTSVRSIPGVEKRSEVVVSSQIEIKPRRKSITFGGDTKAIQLFDDNREHGSATLFNRQLDEPKIVEIENLSPEQERQSYSETEDSKLFDKTTTVAESLKSDEGPEMKPDVKRKSKSIEKTQKTVSKYEPFDDSQALVEQKSIEHKRPSAKAVDTSKSQNENDITQSASTYTATGESKEYDEEEEVKRKSYTVTDNTRMDGSKKKKLQPTNESKQNGRQMSSGRPSELRKQKDVQPRTKRPSYDATRTSRAGTSQESKTPEYARSGDSETYDAQRESVQRRPSYTITDGLGPSNGQVSEARRPEQAITQESRDVIQPKRPTYVSTDAIRPDMRASPQPEIPGFAPTPDDTPRFIDSSSERPVPAQEYRSYDRQQEFQARAGRTPTERPSRSQQQEPVGPTYAPTKEPQSYAPVDVPRPDVPRPMEATSPTYATNQEYRAYDRQRDVQPKPERTSTERSLESRQIEPVKPTYTPTEGPQSYAPVDVPRPDVPRPMEAASSTYATNQEYRAYDRQQEVQSKLERTPTERSLGSRQQKPVEPTYAPTKEPQSYAPVDVSRSEVSRPIEDTSPTYATNQEYRAYDRQQEFQARAERTPTERPSRSQQQEPVGTTYAPTKEPQSYAPVDVSRPEVSRPIEATSSTNETNQKYIAYGRQQQVQPKPERTSTERPSRSQQQEPVGPTYAPTKEPQSYAPVDVSRPEVSRPIEATSSTNATNQEYRAYDKQQQVQPKLERTSTGRSLISRPLESVRPTYAPTEGPQNYAPVEVPRPEGTRPMEDTTPISAPIEDSKAYGRQRSIEVAQGYSTPFVRRSVGDQQAQPTRSRAHDQQRNIEQGPQEYPPPVVPRPEIARQTDQTKPAYVRTEDPRAYNEQPYIQQSPQGYLPPAVPMPDRARQVEPTRPSYAPVESVRAYDGQRNIEQSAQGYPPPAVSRPYDTRPMEPGGPAYAPIQDSRAYNRQQSIEQKYQGYQPPIVSKPYEARTMDPTRPAYAPIQDSRAYDEQRRLEKGQQGYPLPGVSRPAYSPMEDSRVNDRQRGIGQGPQGYTPPPYVSVQDSRAYERQRNIEQGRQGYAVTEPGTQAYAAPEVPRIYDEQRGMAPGRQEYAVPKMDAMQQMYANRDETEAPYMAPGVESNYLEEESVEFAKPSARDIRGKRISSTKGSKKYHKSQVPTAKRQSATLSISKAYDEQRRKRKADISSKTSIATRSADRSSDSFKSDAESRKQDKQKTRKDIKPSKDSSKEETETETEDYTSDSEKQIKADKSPKEAKKPTSKASEKYSKDEESTESESEDYSSDSAKEITTAKSRKGTKKPAREETESEQSTESESQSYSTETSLEETKSEAKLDSEATPTDVSKEKTSPVKQKSVESQRKSSEGRLTSSKAEKNKVPVLVCFEPPRCSKKSPDIVVCEADLYRRQFKLDQYRRPSELCPYRRPSELGPCRRPSKLDPCRRPCECIPCCMPCKPQPLICQPASCKTAICPPSSKRSSARSSKSSKLSKSKKKSSSKKSK